MLKKKYKISNQLLSLLNNSNFPCGIRDLNSRFVYSNRDYLSLLGLPEKFNIEGLSDSNIPHKIADFESRFKEHDCLVIEKKKNILSLDIYPFGHNQLVQPYFCERYPFYNDDNEIIFIIFNYRKAFLFSCLDLIEQNQPDKFYFSAKRFSLFTERELEVIFYLLNLKTAKQIAKRLNLSHRTIENKIAAIYQKSNTNSLIQFISFCQKIDIHRYIPKKLVKIGTKIFTDAPAG